jgi:hypothetical protein
MRVADRARSVGVMPVPVNVVIRAFGYAWIEAAPRWRPEYGREAQARTVAGSRWSGGTGCVAAVPRRGPVSTRSIPLKLTMLTRPAATRPQECRSR